MNQRNFEQSMGMTLTNENIRQPECLKAVAQDLVNNGFEIIRPFLRLTNFTHTAPEVVHAITVLTEAAHALGARVVMDCEPHLKVALDAGLKFSDVPTRRLVCASAQVVDGRFLLHVRNPLSMGLRLDFLGVEAAWLRDASGQMHRIDDLAYDFDGEGEIYQSGFTLKQHIYTEGRPAARLMHTHLKGRLDNFSAGELIVYACFLDRGCIDFWSDGFRRYNDDLVEQYRDSGLDGIGWDEPAIEGTWSNYLYGEAFAAAFQSRKGYSLTDKLYLLDERGGSPESVQVRLDYYETLNEGVFTAQKNLISKSREVFGDNLIFGSHHTWQGEGGGNDYRCGAVDYFRLNDNMDAGYTDCCWWDPKSVIYVYNLASSLGRLTESGEAEVNTWHWKATNAMVEYNARLITLFKVTWFNIFYGDSSEVTRYPAHYTWDLTTKETIRNRKMLRQIGKAEPVAEVAMLHGWETVCGVNRADIANAHKAYCLNQATEFFERNIAFDWVDTRLLESATVAADCLKTQLGSYRILVLPYASILPPKAWQIVREFGAAGGKVVFVGPPPALTTEGECLVGEFSELFDMPELSLSHYLSAIDAQCDLPDSRPDQLEVCCRLDESIERVFTNIEGEAHGIRNAAGNLCYLSDLEPGAGLVKVVEPWLQQEVRCFSDSIFWRLYREDSRSVLVLVARKDRQLVGLVEFAGKQVEFTQGTIAILEFDSGEFSVTGEGLQWQERPS
jgi:hypothetical protein